MNSLTLAVDTRNHYMQVTKLASYRNYLNSAGTDEFPKGTRFVEVTPTAAGIWFNTGDSDVTAAAPSGAVTNGTAAMFVAEGATLRFETTDTHITTTGAALLSYWE